MTTDLHTAALTLALEALEYIYTETTEDEDELIHSAITALREALAEQPAPVAKPHEQEPVAFLVDGDLYYPEEIDWETLQEQGHTVEPLYTHPQAPVVPPHREPLPFNKADMEGLDINQRLGFKLGWRSAEEAHGIGEKK